MAPVPEDTDADEHADARSLQLPSPPASPDGPTTQASSSSSRRRPSLSGRQPAPTAALPHRPRAGTGPSVALPLTAAFQTSVLRSGSSSVSTSASNSPSASVPGAGWGAATPGAGADPSHGGHHQHRRFPSITAARATSPPRASDHERIRPSSVAVRAPLPPADDPLRRMSTTDIRQRHPYAAASSSSAPRADLEVRESSSGRRHAAVYSAPPPSSFPYADAHQPASNFAAPPPHPLSPSAFTPPSPTPASLQPRLSVQTAPSSSSSRASAGNAMNWKSLASGSRASQTTFGGYAYPSGSRSRSGSVRSVSGVSVRAGVLPPIESGPPLSIHALAGTSADEDEERRRNGQ